jgi:hypothetical protein
VSNTQSAQLQVPGNFAEGREDGGRRLRHRSSTVPSVKYILPVRVFVSVFWKWGSQAWMSVIAVARVVFLPVVRGSLACESCETTCQELRTSSFTGDKSSGPCTIDKRSEKS